MKFEEILGVAYYPIKNSGMDFSMKLKVTAINFLINKVVCMSFKISNEYSS